MKSTIRTMTEQFPKYQKAIIVGEDNQPKISTIPFIEPSNDDKIVIRTKAFALNPTDWKHIAFGPVVNSIVGSDVSGVVVKVGKDVKGGFHVGDNVSTLLRGCYKPIPYPAAFSEYVNANPLTTIKYNYDLKLSSEEKIPSGKITTYEGAAATTLSLVTVGLSFYYSLGLDKSNDYSNESILIWSGATATGSIAIQVAKWLGFKDVIVTASPNRFEYLKELGATSLYDYKDPEVVSKIRKDFGDNIIYGLDTFSTKETYSNTYETLSNSKPVTIDNLLILGEKDLEVPLKTNKVKFGSTVVSLVSGEDFDFFGASLKSEKTLIERVTKFHEDVQPLIDEQVLRHIPLTVLPGGFDGLIKGLEILKEGSYGNEKFVARL